MPAKSALVILANGFEEIEAIAPVDILRRAGVKVTVAGLSGLEIEGAHGVKFTADSKLDGLKEEFDAVILPGGGLGAENLSKSYEVRVLVKEMHLKGKIVAAICASPAVVLAPMGILNDKKITCYPSEKNSLPSNVTFIDKPVVVDGLIVTSKGPGTAISFGLKLTELLLGKDAADSLKKKLLV
ncbi:MAG: DJ-1/PfpI family protein [Candidatus Omnitrophica bacterium]|nr:DJ-1/PfpI family protein [Candidatus Omnitrophota bacterium]